MAGIGFDGPANGVCRGTRVITSPPNEFQVHGPGLLPGRLAGKVPRISAVRPVLRAFWEFPKSPAAK